MWADQYYKLINNSKIQFNEDKALPKILHLAWTPTFCRVWSFEPTEDLIEELLTVIFDVYFNPEVIIVPKYLILI